MAGNWSSWSEPGPAAGNGPFDRAAVAPLLDALRDPLEEVRTGALRALVRLPLANEVWLELGEFIGPVLAAPPGDSDVGIPRLELIKAAVYVPMREMRGVLHRLVDEGAADERVEAAHALALARDPYGTPELLVELGSAEPYTQRAGAEALAMFQDAPVEPLRERYRHSLDGDARFWLVVALARAGDPEAVRDYLLDLDAGRIEEPFLVVTSGQPLQELVLAGGPLPDDAGKAAEALAAGENLGDFTRQMAVGLARASVASGPAWAVHEAAEEGLELAQPPDELERLRGEALGLAARYLEESPFSGQELPPPDDWQLLGHLPPEMATRLVTALFAQLSQQVGAGNDVRATQFGNQIMLLPDDLWATFVPDIPSLLAPYAILKGHSATGPAEQLAWVVARAGLGRLLAKLTPRLAATDEALRAAIVSLLERATCYARWDYKPLFGGGSRAGDVLPPAEAFLERESQLESAGPAEPSGEESFGPVAPAEEGVAKGLPEDDDALPMGLPATGDEPVAPPTPRKIQGKVFEIAEPGPGSAPAETLETRAFRAGGEYRLDVWIGPFEAGAIAAPVEFPDHELPPELASYELTVLFWETRPIPRLQAGTITLPRGSGKSTVWPFRFSVDATLSDFEARLQVLYGTRTLQTVILAGRVLPDPASAPAGTAIAFLLDTPVRASAAGLDQAPSRVATIMVDTPAGQPAHITAVAGKRVALRSLEDIDDAIKLIRGSLEQITDDPAAFKSLDGEATKDLLVFLASHGRLLYNAIVKTYLADFPLEGDQPIQVVSARESFFPIEFIYDRPAPLEDAVLCSGAAAALVAGKCTTCEGLAEEEAEKFVCPLGFWALRRVIERHAVRPVTEAGLQGAEYAVETDPGQGRNALNVLSSAVYAASSRVKPEDIEALRTSLDAATGGHLAHVHDWASWREAVKTARPSLLVLVAHTLKNKFKIPTLEIGEQQLLAESNITRRHVCVEDAVLPPVVLLLGCETAVLDIQFENFATQFRVNGAAIVLNTLAPVLGRHVVPVAQMLVEELRCAAETGGTFGSAMLAVRRRGLAAGLPVVLSLVAYGDADWGIRG